ncbi:hypothetical protein HW132_07060 [Brasilonema sp. CT11]|nr:hypothetical protein [Brasilonema sp. CT11]
MKTPHTPSPWTANGNSVIAREYGWQGAIIAECNFKDLKFCTFDTLQSEANALLIAAAPELLHELEALTEFVMNYAWSVDVSGYIKDSLAAIAKAKGI